LKPVARSRLGAEGLEAVDEGEESPDLFVHPDRPAVGAGALGPDVDDIGSVRGHLERLSQCLPHIEGTIPRKGIVVDIDDPHDAGESSEDLLHL